MPPHFLRRFADAARIGTAHADPPPQPPCLESHYAGAAGWQSFYRRWLPAADPPRGVVVLIHGVCEHGGRYAALARALAGGGLAVYVADLRGHGRSPGARIEILGPSRTISTTSSGSSSWPARPIPAKRCSWWGTAWAGLSRSGWCKRGSRWSTGCVSAAGLRGRRPVSPGAEAGLAGSCSFRRGWCGWATASSPAMRPWCRILATIRWFITANSPRPHGGRTGATASGFSTPPTSGRAAAVAARNGRPRDRPRRQQPAARVRRGGRQNPQALPGPVSRSVSRTGTPANHRRGARLDRAVPPELIEGSRRHEKHEKHRQNGGPGSYAFPFGSRIVCCLVVSAGLGRRAG